MNERLLKLLKECIEQESMLSTISHNDLLEFAMAFQDECRALYSVFRNLKERHTLLGMKSVKGLSYGVRDNQHSLGFNNKKILFSEDQVKLFLSITIGIVENILPLGTVVDLEKVYFVDDLPVREIDKLRVVITHRFIGTEGNRYFHYAGVVYPLGTLGQEAYIHFTNDVIGEIVHKGFSDAQDEEFIFLMKEDLIKNKRFQNYSFQRKDPDFHKFR